MYNIYWNIEQKCRKHAKIMACYPLLQQIMYASALYTSISSILAGDYDTSSWNLPFLMSVPFNTERIAGWYLLWFIQLNESLTYAFCMISTTLHFVCCCCYINGLCDHLGILFGDFEDSLHRHRYSRNYQQTKKELIQCVTFHFEIIE